MLLLFLLFIPIAIAAYHMRKGPWPFVNNPSKKHLTIYGVKAEEIIRREKVSRK